MSGTVVDCGLASILFTHYGETPRRSWYRFYPHIIPFCFIHIFSDVGRNRGEGTALPRALSNFTPFSKIKGSSDFPKLLSKLFVTRVLSTHQR